MKKIILTLAVAIFLASCSKNSEQIEIAKQDLKSDGKTEKEIESTKYDVIELIDKDAYSILVDLKNKAIIETISVGGNADNVKKEAVELEKKISESNGTKIFYKVHFYRLVDKDTVSNSILYLDDKNKKIGFQYLK